MESSPLITLSLIKQKKKCNVSVSLQNQLETRELSLTTGKWKGGKERGRLGQKINKTKIKKKRKNKTASFSYKSRSKKS